MSPLRTANAGERPDKRVLEALRSYFDSAYQSPEWFKAVQELGAALLEFWKGKAMVTSLGKQYDWVRGLDWTKECVAIFLRHFAKEGKHGGSQNLRSAVRKNAVEEVIKQVNQALVNAVTDEMCELKPGPSSVEPLDSDDSPALDVPGPADEYLRLELDEQCSRLLQAIKSWDESKRADSRRARKLARFQLAVEVWRELLKNSPTPNLDWATLTLTNNAVICRVVWHEQQGCFRRYPGANEVAALWPEMVESVRSDVRTALDEIFPYFREGN